MAKFSAPDLLTKNRHMGGYGNGNVSWGSVTPTAGGLADVYQPTVIPAGMEVTDLSIINDDLDTNATPTIAAKIGYAPLNAADGPTAVDDYFSATGTYMTAAGRKECVFQPIKFEKAVIVTLTLTTAAATFASGKVTAIAKGIAAGIK